MGQLAFGESNSLTITDLSRLLGVFNTAEMAVVEENPEDCLIAVPDVPVQVVENSSNTTQNQPASTATSSVAVSANVQSQRPLDLDRSIRAVTEVKPNVEVPQPVATSRVETYEIKPDVHAKHEEKDSLGIVHVQSEDINSKAEMKSGTKIEKGKCEELSSGDTKAKSEEKDWEDTDLEISPF